MKPQVKCVGIIKETRIDDARTPLVPEHIKQLKNKYSFLKFVVQPSNLRSFTNKEFEKSGAIISNDLTECDIILGVKEIEPDLLLPKKTYIFFSHTYKLNSTTLINAQGTPGMDKKVLLKSVIDKKIKLIDYENIRDQNGSRFLGFGRFAGIVGCFNTLNLVLAYNKYLQLGRAYKINNYERIKKSLKSIVFPKIKLLITGDGRVAKGVLELLKNTNIQKVSKEEFLDSKIDNPVFCNLKTADYVIHKKKRSFELSHFINFPKEYVSCTLPYLRESNVFISAHYWDPSSPKIFKKHELKQLEKLQIIGDITCDVDGSVPTTKRSTTIEDPTFFINKETVQETSNKKNSICVMAVDNLPSELPRESSTEFGDGIVKHVLPYLIDEDDGRILNATITKHGEFLEKYKYLKNYMNS